MSTLFCVVCLFSGFFNCLGKDGKLLDVTKHGMLQSRQVWMYTELYRKTDRFKTDKILEAAIRGEEMSYGQMVFFFSKDYD